MDILNTFNNKSEHNKYLINENLTLDDLKTYLRLKFLNYKEAGAVAGVSENRVRQFLIGYNLPKSADIISRIAESWGINPIKLTILFESIDNKNRIIKTEQKGDSFESPEPEIISEKNGK